MSIFGLPEPLDSAINMVENNIISRPQRYAFNGANNSGANKSDTVRNNQFVHATKTVGQLINHTTDGYDTGNTVVTAMDLDTSFLAAMPAYRVYNELLRVQPSGTKISFFDLDTPTLPTADAGSDQSIAVSSVTLSGSGTGGDGTITGYEWERISGPNTPTIVSPTSASTSVTGLITGTYVFRLTVTNSLAEEVTDDVTVTVSIDNGQYKGFKLIGRRLKF